MTRKYKYKFMEEKELGVCQDYENGLSERQIAKKYSTSKGHIHYILFRHNVKKRTISEANSGKNGSNYIDGRHIEGQQRREASRKRYGYRCQICFWPQVYFGRKLSVHHKDYNPENNDSDNLIPLCQKDHRQTNFNREYWIEYFNLIVEDKKNKEMRL